MVFDGVGRWGTVRDGEGREFHDGETLAKNGNETVTVTGQNHNFYCNFSRYLQDCMIEK